METPYYKSFNEWHYKKAKYQRNELQTRMEIAAQQIEISKE